MNTYTIGTKNYERLQPILATVVDHISNPLTDATTLLVADDDRLVWMTDMINGNYYTMARYKNVSRDGFSYYLHRYRNNVIWRSYVYDPDLPWITIQYPYKSSEFTNIE